MNISAEGKMRKIVFFLVIVSFVILAKAAYTEEMKINGYTISVIAENKSGNFSVDGRVEGGAKCKKLELHISLRDEKKNTVSVIAIVEDVRGGPRN